MFNDCLAASGEHLSFDEGMGRFYGRVTGLKKHMPNKPIKEGFEFLTTTLVCALISTWRMAIPIDLTNDTEAGTTGHYLMELLKKLSGEGCKGYCDNLYSSPALFVEAKIKHDAHLVGTLRADRGVLCCRARSRQTNVQRVL